MTPETRGVVGELAWQPESAAANQLQLELNQVARARDPNDPDCEPTPNIPEPCTADSVLTRVSGTSPLVITFKLPTESMTLNNRTYELYWTVYPSDSADPPAVIVEQRVRMYSTFFYNMDPPENFSAI